MLRKGIAVITLIVFSFTHFSCKTTVDEKDLASVTEKERSQVVILAVTKVSGETVVFDEKKPGKIKGDAIVGTAVKERSVHSYEIEEIIRSAGKIIAVVTKDGERIHAPLFEEVKEESGWITFVDYEEISIPLSDVEFIKIKKVTVTTLGAVLIVVAIFAVFAGIIAAIVSASSEEEEEEEPPPPPPGPAPPTTSCPFVYSFDGEQFVFDAEPYGGAICEGLKRTEWSELEHLRAVDGQYRLLMRNELDETQYTDELKLVVTDHPEEVRVISSITGEFHTISDPIAPTRAYDGRGKDLLYLVSEKDMRIWQTETEGRDPNRHEDLRDELFFEFPKPKHAKQVKLYVNANTTLWGSKMSREYLELFGGKVDAYYAELNRRGRFYHDFEKLVIDRGMYIMKIGVKSGDRWVTKGLLYGGGPLNAEDVVYVLDIDDVPGEILTIKLVAPVTFWMINHLAVDYSDDVQIEVEELQLYRAIAHDGRELRELLLKEDGVYYEMPELGDWAELSFLAPEQDSSFARTIFVKASGYYDMHLKREGIPRYIAILRSRYDKDFMIRYSLQNYLQREQEIKRQLAKAAF